MGDTIAYGKYGKYGLKIKCTAKAPRSKRSVQNGGKMVGLGAFGDSGKHGLVELAFNKFGDFFETVAR